MTMRTWRIDNKLQILESEESSLTSYRQSSSALQRTTFLPALRTSRFVEVYCVFRNTGVWPRTPGMENDNREASPVCGSSSTVICLRVRLALPLFERFVGLVCCLGPIHLDHMRNIRTSPLQYTNNALENGTTRFRQGKKKTRSAS